MRLTLPIAAAAIALFGAGCAPPEPEGRINEPIAPKADGTTPTPETKTEGATSDVNTTPEGTTSDPKTTPEAAPKDEATGMAPLTPPPAAGGKPESEQGKVGG